MSHTYSRIRFVLMDIEGTISDIRFVRNVLFPYSARELRNFVAQNKNNARVRECLHSVAKEIGANDDEGAITQLLMWITADNKHPALKTLQGMIWSKGYNDGAFRSHLYPDVVPRWQMWREQGLRLGIYSSGSIEAQKLFFTYTEQGDVLNQLEAHFDLATGPKRDMNSYARIVGELGLPASEVLFLSDITAELDAARSACLQTGLIERDGANAGPTDHAAFTALDQILVEGA